MFYTETIELTTEKNSVTDITPEMKRVLEKSGVKNGLIVVEVPHSTAGVMATTGGPVEVREDLMHEVKRVVPSRINFRHEESPDDAAGHIKCGLFGNSITGIVKDGKMVSDGKLGYFFMEYDGPRARKYCIAVMGE
ncbi:MAG: secondary thiamine-phosphate synthase enzyme YjbQ [Oscillospiraceae bacterium]|jgi:secondary thiamine-phosphate synthase enzyme